MIPHRGAATRTRYVNENPRVCDLSDPLEKSQDAEDLDEDFVLANDLVERGDEAFEP